MGFGDVALSAQKSPEVAEAMGDQGLESTSFIIFRMTGVLNTKLKTLNPCTTCVSVCMRVSV